MALTGKIELTNSFGWGSEFPRAYVNVREVAANKETALATVAVFDDPGGRLLDEQRVPFVPDLGKDSSNFIQQAYQHLKTIDQFNALGDC